MKPQRIRKLGIIEVGPHEWELVEEEIDRLFKESIYAPLLKELGLKPQVENSVDDLYCAIASGRIRYHRGHFNGRFSAGVSKELRALGAEWDPKHGSWKISLSKIDTDVKSAIVASEDRFKKAAEKIDRRLKDIVPEELANKFSIEKAFDRTIYRMNRSFLKNIDGISLAPNLTDDDRKRLRGEYERNLKRSIRDFTEEQTEKLRRKVNRQWLGGGRHESLAEDIQKSYWVSKSKAKFLARQETRLMSAKFQEVRYQSAGVNEYEWTCVTGSANHPVRPMHKQLNGKICRFDDPPVVNERGDRKNPGEDFNCRCKARAVVRF